LVAVIGLFILEQEVPSKIRWLSANSNLSHAYGNAMILSSASFDVRTVVYRL